MLLFPLTVCIQKQELIFKIQQIITQAGALLSLEKVWVSLQSSQHRVHLFLLNEYVLDVHLDEMGSYLRWRFFYSLQN